MSDTIQHHPTMSTPRSKPQIRLISDYKIGPPPELSPHLHVSVGISSALISVPSHMFELGLEPCALNLPTSGLAQLSHLYDRSMF
jgi:hypothetical protein